MIDGDAFFELMIRNGWNFVPIQPKHHSGSAPEDSADAPAASSRRARKSAGGDGGDGTAYYRLRDRVSAATNMASAFRGHKGRAEGSKLRRRADAREQEREAEEAEKARMAQKPHIFRPQLKNAYGF